MSAASRPDPTAAFHLGGETALITGGGSGLGLGMARCLVAAGARVVLVGRRPDVLERACAELGDAAVAVPGDITQLDNVPGLAARAEELAGPLTVVINNAGVHLKKPAMETSDMEFAKVLQTHVGGAFALTREIGARLVQRRRGSVIFITSMTALIGMPSVVAYSTAKTAYLGLVRALSTEWGPHNVRVNAIAPGWIASDMLEQALAGDPARKARILARTPLGRFGHPNNVGWTAVFLASPAAEFISGAIVPVDGGAAESF
jgi:gluconate 5-dehydrogenase